MRPPKWFGPSTLGSCRKITLKLLSRSLSNVPLPSAVEAVLSFPRLRERKVDIPVVLEVRVERHIEQPSLAAVKYFRDTRERF
jgi:hypothetical protein